MMKLNYYYRYIFLFVLVLLYFSSFAQDISIISWNIKDFGSSRDDLEMKDIAKLLRNVDIVAIQEVVAIDPGGAQAVGRLVDQLNRMGASWDYVISDRTMSSSPYKSERYAFLWKKHKVKIINRGKLISELSSNVEREPFIAQFQIAEEIVTILNYHACTHDNSFPERNEILSISDWIVNNSSENIIFGGDMNLVRDDIAFNKLKSNGYKSVLKGEKTSLKRKCIDGKYHSRAEDNIFIKFSDFSVIEYKVIDFISNGDCNDVIWKRNSYSDHLPIQIIIRKIN
ncbi:MAG: endonuclease/exonuclease/phosphatase family protein [Saprospiraceae bacterium]